MRQWLLGVCAAALVGAPTALAFFSGGFFDEPRLIAAVLVWVAVAVAAIWSPQPFPRSTAGRLAVFGLAALCAWTALSIAWAPLGGRAQDDLQRLLLYTGFVIAAAALLRGRAARRALEPGIALGALVVVLYALSERLLPGLIEFDRSATSSGRLEQPLTYWNALGIVAAVGTILASRVAGDSRRSDALRALHAGAGVVLGLGVYLTFARGALAAVAIGLLVLLAFAPDIRLQARAVIAVGVAAVPAAVLASSFDTVSSLDERDAAEGLIMAGALLMLAVAAALTVLPRAARRRPAPGFAVSRPAAVGAVAIVGLVAGGLLFAAFEGKPEDLSPAPGADPARLGSIDTNRYRYWDVALESFGEQPVGGSGSGGFVVDWLRVEDRVDASADAHSLFLETAAELGIIGLAVLFLFLGGTGAALVRLYRADPASATGLAAGVVAWTFHAGLDWDWEMPAVTLPALLLAAAAVAWSEEQGSRRGEAADADGPDVRVGLDRPRDRAMPAPS